MKNSPQFLILSIWILVLGAVAEELLPKFLGVGFPILLSATCYFGSRKTVFASSFVALTAGGMTDALSSLPPMTSASFFLMAALASRFFPLPSVILYAAFPCYQIWLALWTPAVGNAVFARILLSVPMGVVTAACVALALTLVERRAAVDEVE